MYGQVQPVRYHPNRHSHQGLGDQRRYHVLAVVYDPHTVNILLVQISTKIRINICVIQKVDTKIEDVAMSLLSL